MKQSKTIINSIYVLVLLICFINPALADENESLDNNVANIIKPIMHKYAIAGTAVIVYKDGQLHHYNFGVMNNKTHKPITSDTIFELGSITKSFSGLLLAEQINAGKMHLDDKVYGYLENSNNDSNSIKNITLLELATHTSGLPSVVPNLAYNAAYSPRNTKTLKQFLQTWISAYQSGTEMLYSNIGFSILGIAIANYKGMPLFALMQSHILIPLNMHNSFFSVPKNVRSLYAQGYTADGKPSRTPLGGLYPGSWAMKSSANDMSHYLSAAIGVSNTPESITAAMKVAQTGYFKLPNEHQIGLGWMVIPLANANLDDLLSIEPLKPSKHNPRLVERISSPQYIANALIEKTGATNGFRAYIGVIPEQKIGIVILTNKFIYDPSVIEHSGREILFKMR